METVNQENTATTNENNDKLFTQDELDGIVKDRLQRERAKYADYDSLKDKAAKFDAIEEENKTELQKANDKAAELQKELDDIKKANTIRQMREKVAKDSGVPVELLTAETEDECVELARKIVNFAKPNGYPNVKDGGEARFTGKRTTRDQFAEWFNNIDN